MKKRKKKRKLRISAILILILFFYLFYYIISSFLNIKISNIYISNNYYLEDQEIIEIAKINNYPSSIKNTKSKIEKRLEENIYILEAKVTKKKLTKLYIKIKENTPLFYNKSLDKTILYDGKSVDKRYYVPTLINYIPDTLYDEFLDSMKKIDRNILEKISEIKYDPNEVDDKRFILTMNDGNYVYLTLYKFNNINNYIEILKKLNNEKGILYLDSGNFFEKY